MLNNVVTMNRTNEVTAVDVQNEPQIEYKHMREQGTGIWQIKRGAGERDSVEI